MQLTQYEQDLLAGTYGKGLQTAMEIVTAFGRLYGADHLIPVNSAHIDAAAYTTIWDSGIDFVEKLDTSVYNAHVLHIASHMLSNPAKVFLPCGRNCGTVMFLFFTGYFCRTWDGNAGVFVF